MDGQNFSFAIIPIVNLFTFLSGRRRKPLPSGFSKIIWLPWILSAFCLSVYVMFALFFIQM